MVQAQIFHRNQTLVVVHGHHHVGTGLASRAVRIHEHGVGWVGATHLQAQLLGLRNGRGNLGQLFRAKQTILTSMRVQARHHHARCAAMQLQPSCVGDAQGLQHIGHGDGIDGLSQGHMDADQHGAQAGAAQHHAHRQVGH